MCLRLRGPAVSHAAALAGMLGIIGAVNEISGTVSASPVLSQVLTLVEHAVLLYRALLPTPAWVRYFEGAGLGSVLTACYTGAPPFAPPLPLRQLPATVAVRAWGAMECTGCAEAQQTCLQKLPHKQQWLLTRTSWFSVRAEVTPGPASPAPAHAPWLRTSVHPVLLVHRPASVAQACAPAPLVCEHSLLLRQSARVGNVLRV